MSTLCSHTLLSYQQLRSAHQSLQRSSELAIHIFLSSMRTRKFPVMRTQTPEPFSLQAGSKIEILLHHNTLYVPAISIVYLAQISPILTCCITGWWTERVRDYIGRSTLLHDKCHFLEVRLYHRCE